MNIKALANVGATAIVGGAAATAASAVGCVKLWNWLQETARETVVETIVGKPYENSYWYHEGDYDIHYQIDYPEAGVPVIGKMFLIHGFACNTRFWDEMVDILLKKGFICVRPDVPNCGFSTRETKDVKPIDREVLLMHLLDVVDKSDKIPAGKWILMGHSMGGGISMNLAYEYKDKFSCVMMYAPMCAVNAPNFVKKLVTLDPMCNLMDKIFGPCCSHNPLVKSVIMLMTVDVRYSALFETYKFADGLTVPKSGTAMCYMMARAKPTLYENMAKVDLPIKLFWGKMDLFNAPGVVKKFQNALNNPDVTVTPLAGHCLVQNCAPEVCDESLAFLKRNNIIG
ncbi:MAG: alpha/beta hydrolase [Clostridia bacterium]|nr:alpha/beta hydrolase [Clostridia bacterium]